jgi:hypothetical protein
VRLLHHYNHRLKNTVGNRVDCPAMNQSLNNYRWFGSSGNHLTTKGFSQIKRLMDKVDIEYIYLKDGFKKIALEEYCKTLLRG